MYHFNVGETNGNSQPEEQTAPQIKGAVSWEFPGNYLPLQEKEY